MLNAIKATLWGLALGLVVFLVSGYGVYAILWWFAGMNRIPPDSTPAAALGGLGALAWGIVAGATLGLVSAALCARYCYRRYILPNEEVLDDD